MLSFCFSEKCSANDFVESPWIQCWYALVRILCHSLISCSMMMTGINGCESKVWC